MIISNFAGQFYFFTYRNPNLRHLENKTIKINLIVYATLQKEKYSNYNYNRIYPGYITYISFMYSQLRSYTFYISNMSQTCTYRTKVIKYKKIIKAKRKIIKHKL